MMTTATMMRLLVLTSVVLTNSLVLGFALSSPAMPPRTGRTTSSALWVSAATTTSTSTPSSANTILEIKSHADWMELLFDSDPTNQPKVTAVLFHASWCKFCQKFRLRWNQLHRKHYSIGSTSTHQQEIRFASVEYTANRKLCQSLGVEHLPTIQFYHQDRLLHSAPCSPKGFSVVAQRMELYLQRTADKLEQAADSWEDDGVDAIGRDLLLP